MLVAHHRLLELIGDVPPPRTPHPVGDPGKAGPVEVAVVVRLEREVPVVEKRHVEAGVHTAEVRDDGGAAGDVVAGVAEGVASDAHHAGPVGEAGNVGTDFKIGPGETGIDAEDTEERIADVWPHRRRGGAHRDVAVAPQIAIVGEPFARHADLVVRHPSSEDITPAGVVDPGVAVLVLVAVVVPVDADAADRTAEELLADDTDIGEEATVVGEMTAEISRPEPAQVVLGVGDEPAERHVATAVAETAVGGIQPVVQPPRPGVVEVCEPGSRPVHDAADRRHAHLPRLSEGGAGLARRRGGDQHAGGHRSDATAPDGHSATAGLRAEATAAGGTMRCVLHWIRIPDGGRFAEWISTVRLITGMIVSSDRPTPPVTMSISGTTSGRGADAAIVPFPPVVAVGPHPAADRTEAHPQPARFPQLSRAGHEKGWAAGRDLQRTAPDRSGALGERLGHSPGRRTATGGGPRPH